MKYVLKYSPVLDSHLTVVQKCVLSATPNKVQSRTQRLATLFDFTDGRVSKALGNVVAFSL